MGDIERLSAQVQHYLEHGAVTDETRRLSADNARLRAANEELAAALEKIAQQCNGYGDVAGWACLTARAALGSKAAKFTVAKAKE